MHIWPTSGTLTEDNASPSHKPTAGGAAGGAGGNASVFSMGAGMPAINAGEIMLSQAESRALAALETEPDEAHGKRRARAESGLTDQQISALQRRAKHALSKGITLKGVGFVRKPTAGPPEEPSLVRRAKKENAEAMEALREQARQSVYTLPPESDYRFPVANSMGESDGIDSVHVLATPGLPRKSAMAPARVEAQETNSRSTMAALTMAARRMRNRKR